MKNKDKIKKKLAAAKRRIARLEKLKAKFGQTKMALDKITSDMAKYKKTREILLTKERLNYLLSATTAVIYTSKPSGDYGTTFITDNVFQTTGYKPQEFIENSNFWIKHVHPDDRQRILKEVTRVFKKRVYSYEYRFLCKNGRYIWMRDEMKCVRDDKGQPIEIIGYWADISKGKKAEEELEIQSQILLNMAEGVNVSDDKKKIFFTNPRFDTMFGYKHGELIGKNVSILNDLAPKENARFINKIVKQLKQKGHWFGEFSNRKKNGTNFTTRAHVSAIEISGKRYYISVQRDITERKKTEEELHLRNEITKNMAEGVNVVRASDGMLVYTNPKFEKMFGYRPAELIGKNVSILNAPMGKSPEKIAEQIQRCLKRDGVWQKELLNIKKNGVTFWCRHVVSTFQSAQHGTAWVGVVENITERKKMEENLKELNKELLRSNEKLKQLTLKDPQTGLYSHHYLHEAIEAEFYRAKRYVHPFSIVMLDIDYFKSINDLYGHKFGDFVLKQVAKQLMSLVRRYDIIIRFGGEEFVIIFPGTDRITALTLMRRLSDSLRLYNFGDKEHSIKLTFSIAVVSSPEDRVIKYMDLVDLAENILDKVKDDGGDRVYSSLDTKEGEKEKTLLIEEKEDSANIKFLKERMKKLSAESRQNLFESILAFAKTIELKDHYTGEHVEKTVYYASEIARVLGLPEEEVMHVKQAAILHDLGKVGISEKILLKRAKLKKDEFKEIMKHPQIGTDIIRPIKFLHDIIPLILYHHENWDGTGYPSGLKGDEIPMGARIIAIADVYQALTSDRPYRKAYSHPKAIKIIKELSGAKFDPKVVKVFLKILKGRIA